jgi:hypothetical protein
MNSKEVGASQAPNIFYLDKIISLKKQLQVHDILMHFGPTHEERLWLVGFLKYAGYKYKEVLDILDQHCQWSDYNADTTAYQVATIFKQGYRGVNGSSHIRRKRKWDLSELEVWRINLARTSEMNRRLTAWMKENDTPILESPHCQSLPFKPETLLRGGL